MSEICLDVAHLAARFLNVRLPMGLVLDEVLVEGEGLRLEGEPLQITLEAPGQMTVRVSAASLSAFLNEKKPGGLSGFRTEIGGGLLQIEARAPLLPFTATAHCRLEIVEGRELHVRLERLASIGGSGAATMVQRQLDGLNPIVDLAEFPVQATLESVEGEDDWLILLGTIAPP